MIPTYKTEDAMKTSEGGVEVGGKEFRFIKPTIDSYIQLVQHDKEFTGLDFAKIAESRAEYRKFRQTWRKFCNGIFKRSFFWFLLSPFGYLPKELRFDSLKMTEPGMIKQSFFVWQEAAQTEPNGLSAPSPDSK